MDDKEIMQIIIKSQEKAYQTALETAIRSGTSLIGTRKGKVVKIKPKYKYVLVPIKPSKKKKVSREKGAKEPIPSIESFEARGSVLSQKHGSFCDNRGKCKMHSSVALAIKNRILEHGRLVFYAYAFCGSG